MPFNIFGEKIEEKITQSPTQKPVKVRLVKRGQSVITAILNLNLSEQELQNLASEMKRTLGCGGAVKSGEIELQGDKVAPALTYLKQKGIKAS